MERLYDAKFILHGKAPEDLSELIGGNISGWIFEDKKQEGNHPFKNGQYFHTTTVQEVLYSGAGEAVIVTRNTRYLYRGYALSQEKAYSGMISLTGDPVS